MKNKIIIGISGKKRSGKNTIALAIKKAYYKASSNGTIPNLVIKELAFADAVKEVAAVALGLPKDEFFNDECKQKEYLFFDGTILTGRQILQKIGTDCLRNHLNYSIWITNIQNKIKRSNSDIFIITDVRFKNEMDFLVYKEAYSIRVNRLDLPNDDNHISEVDLDEEKRFDLVVTSNSSEPDYKQRYFELSDNVIIPEFLNKCYFS